MLTTPGLNSDPTPDPPGSGPNGGSSLNGHSPKPPGLPMFKESVRGVLRSSNASAGVEIQLFSAGSDEVRALADSEFLTVNSVLVSIGAGNGDVRVQFGDDSAAAATTIFRGSLAANGIADVQWGQGMSGPRGLAPHAFAPSGDIDVILTGHITRA